MKPLGTAAFATVGAGLIALAYGLARFAFGLFVPAIREDLALDAAIMGQIGALAFVSFVAASLFASPVTERLGPRRTALLAAGLGTAGLALIALAANAAMLGAGVFICGVCTGLMMPALSAGAQSAVPGPLRGRVNAVMNAGTTIGVGAAAPAALLWPDSWRSGYLAFAGLALLATLAATRLPRRGPSHGDAAAATPALSRDERRAIVRVGGFALATGVLTAPFWIFAPDLAVTLGDLPKALVGLIWLAVAAGGMAGMVTGDLVRRLGPAPVHGAALILVGLATAALVLMPASGLMMTLAAVAFGAGYMTLTGLYVVVGVGLLPRRPALGPVVPFAAIAVGQAVGSALAGEGISGWGYGVTFLATAGLATVAAATSSAVPTPATGATTPTPPEDAATAEAVS